MRGVGLVAVGGFVWLGACGPRPYACEQDDECSRRASGRCEAGGGCSYPDDACPSGRRFSPFSPIDPGRCLEPEGGTTTTGPVGGSDSGSDESGDGPPSCDGVTCSGRGRCVEVDGAATCDCEVGLYDVGGACLEDPCDAVTCWFTDAIGGSDQGAGTQDDPWQTIGRTNQAIEQAQPGDHFMLRRGRTYSGQELLVRDVAGEAEAPIVVGAYGPVDDPRPDIDVGAIRIVDASHVELRDLTVHDDPTTESPNRPCVRIESSDHVTIRDAEVYDCHQRGIRVMNGSSHTALVGNYVHDTGNQAALFVNDTTWAEPDPVYIGPHHWIVGNVLEGVQHTGIEAEAGDGVGDMKILDNTVVGATNRGIQVTNTAYAWVVGNTITGVRADAGAPEEVGRGLHIGSVAGQFEANVVVDAFEGLNMQGQGSVERNTIMVEGGGYALRLSGAGPMEIHDNLVAAADTSWVLTDGELPGEWLTAMDRNVYAPLTGTECVLRVAGTNLDFPSWQMMFGYDAAGACESVAGLSSVSGATLPLDEGFWGSVTPDGGWSGCESTGALDCEGQRRAWTLQPLEGLEDGDGLGWEGPLVVRQRYPL